jgi:hypothetical protein
MPPAMPCAENRALGIFSPLRTRALSFKSATTACQANEDKMRSTESPRQCVAQSKCSLDGHSGQAGCVKIGSGWN